MNPKVFLQTYGCQMNERDSEEILGMLSAQGYDLAESPEDADVVLLNTCSVRAHAEDRAYGRAWEVAQIKKERPELVLGMIGCMAKLHQAEIMRRIPAVDLVAGPAELYDLPYLLAELQARRQQAVVARSSWLEARSRGPEDRASGFQLPAKTIATGRHIRPLDRKPSGDYRRPGVTAFVTIMEGCDKACTYCIVPTTRGQEVSRPVEEILAEIHGLVEAGYKEITLLGQNVNSYGKRFPDGSGYRGPLGRLRQLEEDPDGLLDFAQLLRKIDAQNWGQVPGGEKRGQSPFGDSPPHNGDCPPLRPWIRFTTSHPFDANERMFRAMAECETVAEWLHLPVQSGSNRILRAMRRGYTAEAYLAKVERLRALVPGIALTTDIIVGFPGETEEDFQATEQLMKEVRYESAYIFKYSPRPGTDAAAREDDVSAQVKEERNRHLLALQARISREEHEALVGQEVEILVESRGRSGAQWFGRTRGHHGVIVASPENLLGRFVRVRLDRGTEHTLFGEPLTACNVSSDWSDRRRWGSPPSP